MTETKVAIGQVKRDISELVNRVAYGGEKIILTSRGKLKAVLVGMADYKRLQREQANERLAHWQARMAEIAKLTAEIMARREGQPLDVDALWQAARAVYNYFPLTMPKPHWHSTGRCN